MFRNAVKQEEKYYPLMQWKSRSLATKEFTGKWSIATLFQTGHVILSKSGP